jgi:hypothetical protein
MEAGLSLVVLHSSPTRVRSSAAPPMTKQVAHKHCATGEENMLECARAHQVCDRVHLSILAPFFRLKP